jgi:pimeloyl-ACP methyl ester carboxylesterase
MVELPDGATLAVQDAGPSDATALLLLQGQANSHVWWTGLRDTFEDEYRTITLDYRGTGGTDADETEWSTALFADDARRVLDALDLETAHVYGTSMGGRVAQMLALDAPDRVGRLVLACTSPGGTIGHERGHEVRRALTRSDAGSRVDALLHLMYTPAWFGLHRRSHLLGDPSMTPRAQMLHLRASAGHDAAGRLSEIAVPTLVLHGEDDLMAPVANAELIAQRIKGASVSITRGGRHGFFDEFRERVSREVLDFLGQH